MFRWRVGRVLYAGYYPYIKGYPFINFMTKARSIPSFDNLANIIIRIPSFFDPTQKRLKGWEMQKIISKGWEFGWEITSRKVAL